MPRYVIDSYAWIEYFIGSEKGRTVKTIVESDTNEIFTPAIVVAEVVSITSREDRDVELIYNNMLLLSKISSFTPEFAKETGLLHAKMRKTIKDIGMADIAVLLTARNADAKIVTGDPHFKGMKNVLFIG